MTAGDGNLVEGFIEALLDDDPETLYERAPCGYLSTTPDGSIIKANSTFLSLTGYTREELLGRRSFVDLLTTGGRIYHETHYAPMLRMHGIAQEIAFELITADGRKLPVLVNAALDHDESGQPVVIRTAVFDATNRRKYEEELLRAKQRAEASEARAVALARTLQQTLIPPTVPDIIGLEIGTEYRPAGDGGEVGGDFYDIFQAGEDDWVVAIGDVCGKGVGAAVVTALARYTLRAATMQDPSPAHALSVLNEALHRADTDRFCTAVVLRLRRTHGNWTVTSCAAGHAPPLRIRADRRIEELGRSGSLLGVLDEVELADSSALASPGDLLLLYTDGVSEARSSTGQFYGEQRLNEIVSSLDCSAHGFTAALLADVLDFQDGVARDDIALVAVQVLSG